MSKDYTLTLCQFYYSVSVVHGYFGFRYVFRVREGAARVEETD
jgi:hypothetical protein